MQCLSAKIVYQVNYFYLDLHWLVSAVLVRINFNLQIYKLIENHLDRIDSDITHIGRVIIKHFWNLNFVILAIIVINQLELDLEDIFKMF
jgi:hypothetical protein